MPRFDTLDDIVSIAVVTFRFDPYVVLFGDLAVRWGAIALAAVIVITLLLAAVIARAGGSRTDDVAFVAIGIVPGAVVGGRLGYFLLHEGSFGTNPAAVLDPSVGGLELGLAVVGGTLTGAYVASLLGASAARWLSTMAAPTLFALGAGKLTMVLTGAGQGQASDASWATAFVGPGPWGSLVPELPSHPSQAYEGIATLAILAILGAALMLRSGGRDDARIFLVAIGAWAVARMLVSLTWRDPVAALGLNLGGLIAAGIAIGCAILAVVVTVRPPLADDPPAETSSDIDRPDGTTRPRP